MPITPHRQVLGTRFLLRVPNVTQSGRHRLEPFLRKREIEMCARRFVLALTAVTTTAELLSGCTTPPGKLTDADLVSRTVDIQQSTPKVVSTFYDAFRYCGPISGTGFFNKVAHGVPDCGPPRPDGTAICDIYAGRRRDRSDLVLGRADFQPTEHGTTVILRIQKWIADKEVILGTWEKFLYGQAEQVCPAK